MIKMNISPTTKTNPKTIVSRFPNNWNASFVAQQNNKGLTKRNNRKKNKITTSISKYIKTIGIKNPESIEDKK